MTGQAQRMILLLALVVAGLLLVMMALVFLWPGDQSEWVDVGRADSFAPGTVTSFRIVDGRANLVTTVPNQQVAHGHGVHIVRLDDGELRAFSWASTHRRWAVAWQRGIPPHDDRDVFVDRFSLGMWEFDGTVITGPPGRNLDQYWLEVRSSSPPAPSTPRPPAATPPAPAGAP